MGHHRPSSSIGHHRCLSSFIVPFSLHALSIPISSSFLLKIPFSAIFQAPSLTTPQLSLRLRVMFICMLTCRYHPNHTNTIDSDSVSIHQIHYTLGSAFRASIRNLYTAVIVCRKCSQQMVCGLRYISQMTATEIRGGQARD